MAARPDGRGLLRGLVMLALLWWGWSATPGWATRRGPTRAFSGSHCSLRWRRCSSSRSPSPRLTTTTAGGLYAPVRARRLLRHGADASHLVVYRVAPPATTASLRRQLLAPPSRRRGPAAAGRRRSRPAPWQSAAVAAGARRRLRRRLLLGGAGWRLESPAHFAERHGLIIIIALGESIVAIGVGIADVPVTVPIVAPRCSASASRSPVVGLLRRGRAGRRAGAVPGWGRASAAGWPATRSPTCTSRCWSASSTWRSA